MINSSSSSSSFVVTPEESPHTTVSSSVVLQPEEQEERLNISQKEWDSIRPYIDEHEIAGLDYKARMHIILSALACNLDSSNNQQVLGGNYSAPGTDDDGGGDGGGGASFSNPSISTSSSVTSSLYCPRIFDGWSCWNQTPAGEVANAPCPWFVTGFEAGRRFYMNESAQSWSSHCIRFVHFSTNAKIGKTERCNMATESAGEKQELRICHLKISNLPSQDLPFTGTFSMKQIKVNGYIEGCICGKKGIAHKECMKDGTWFKHPLTNLTWSNYTTCVDLEALQVYQNVNLVYEVGYLISVCALVLSLFIFCRFRSLSCTRVTIHKHLFASFIINNSLWLVWYRTVVNSGITVNELNQLYCAIIHILTHYFMMANYFWMFCEGFYLHTLLVYAFTRAESKLLRWFYVFGWLGPSIPLGLYTTFRGTDSDPTERKECWIHDSKWSLLISGPVCICLVVSLAFLINIVRVLVMKLNASRRVTRTVHGRNNSTRLLERNGSTTNRRESNREGGDSASSLRKASRATLILIPLLGLHYFIIPFRPEGDRWAAIVYEYVAAFTSSLQGLAVSLIFCFCNGEVIATLRRHLCPSSSSSDGTYHDYSCGGKLLRNVRQRLFRRGGGQGANANYRGHCSPSTTIMATTQTVVMTLDDDMLSSMSVTPEPSPSRRDTVQLVVVSNNKYGQVNSNVGIKEEAV